MKKDIKWPIIGNDHVAQYLERILDRDEAGGAYIFNGPDNLGKTTTALHFAKFLSCRQAVKYQCDGCRGCRNILIEDRDDEEGDMQGSDLYFVKKNKDKKNISIEQIRTLIKVLSLSSFSGSYKVGIIKHAETMSEEAANALLKTLEEPRQKVVIILITDNLSRMLKTIISRSQIINFRLVNTDKIYDHLLAASKIDRAQTRSIARRCSGRPALAAKFAEDQEFAAVYKERVNAFIDIFFSRDISDRLSKLEDLLDKNWSNQETVAAVKRIFEVWLSAARDMVNYELNNKYLIQNEEVEKKCDATSALGSLPKIIELIRMINSAKGYLDANVNPRLVMENILINY